MPVILKSVYYAYANKLQLFIIKDMETAIYMYGVIKKLSLIPLALGIYMMIKLRIWL